MIRQLTEASLTSFVLNEQIESLVAENRILSQKCKHEFKNGFCVYCYTKKNKQSQSQNNLTTEDKVMQVRKRDGRLTEFDSSKIENAVLRAFQAVDGTITDYAREKAKNIAAYVESTCQPSSIIDIETIQDYVENGLMSCKRKDVARAYIKYRDERNRNRLRKTKIRNTVRKKLYAEDVENQNANMDERSFGGRMGSALSAVMREEALEDGILSQMARDHHLNNEIYIHDLDHYAAGDHNCLSMPLDQLLANGFVVRQTSVRPANSVTTALQLIAVLFQIQSLQQFGGVSSTHLDWTLVPYVRKSFAKHYRDGLKYIEHITEPDYEIDRMLADATTYSIEDTEYEAYSYSAAIYAREMLERDIAQAVEAFLHNLNTLQSRSGN